MIKPRKHHELMDAIYFYTNQQLDKVQFETFLFDNFNSSEFVWITDFYDFAVDNEINSQKTYISLVTLAEGFKYHYSVYDSYSINLSLRGQIEVLKKLADKTQLDILLSDDEANPWTWVFIERNGQTSTVTATDESTLVIDDFYNLSFGSFRTKTELTNPELDILKQIIAQHYPKVDVNYENDKAIMSDNLDELTSHVDQLSSFDNYYEIVPCGKNEWLDKNEKSKLFIDLMLLFRKEVNKDLCLFPSNYSEVKNIEGGSDSEEHCLVATENELEKIVYKRRRKSWVV